MASKSVALITMSTRGVRVGPNVAAFVNTVVEKPLGEANITVSPVDLGKFNLPVYNESVIPAMVPEKAQFQYEHSKAWSAEISKHDGYILVIPEYNYGVAGGTKNAIDYLVNEWKGKPVVIVSYGVQGGTKANEQVKDCLTGVGLNVCETRPTLAFSGGRGPDLFAAIEGKLGDNSKKEWEAGGDIAKAARELKDILSQPNVEENVAKV
ncbi:Uu.00g085010.m01.CDS01 [Anthostomella pinea]|uniref:Uu.00g085010.m01.CDS01 n=1 Tax=Anthostomella pinea TaxID=933095 RepID=A0AAI8VN12_9PEZI|nr:Uu.00g085010.m01.CDS01 [Anthostomella pinea]